MDYRLGTKQDLDRLAEWNYQLIRAEGHSNLMTVRQLRNRMDSWLNAECKAVIFSVGQSPVAYALYQENEAEIYLRQFYVLPGFRRKGNGRKAIGILRTKLWPLDKRLTVEVLSNNQPAVQFWRAVGYREYSIKFEIRPKGSGD